MDPRYIDDPVRVYVHEVCQVPPLNPDEEVDLWRHLRAKDDQSELAKKRLLEVNLILVVSIAERYRSASPLHVLDLIQEGNTGLLFAFDTFTGDSSESFSTHAATYIEKAISKAIEDLQQPRK